jgi:solute carrier family 25 protein 39/40
MVGVRQMVAAQGVHKLWTGLAPTLWRDVPFSAMYWYGYELSKRSLNRRYPGLMNDAWGAYWVSFLSGAASGMVAAIVTTPFDVAKTRNQISASDASMKLVDLMKTIVKEEGWRGLMSGWTARVAKVAPSCAIMISTYEIGKRFTATE